MSQHDTHADAGLRTEMYAVCGDGFNWFGNDRAVALTVLRKQAGTMYVQIQELDAARATIAALQARCDAGDTLAFEAHEVTESWAEGHVTGMVELSLAVRAYYAALRASAAAQRATGTTPTEEGE